MAPKKAEEVVDNPPTSSEEEESGSSGEESESSAEVSKKDESSKKPESDSEGEYESESESDSEPAKTMELMPLVTKPIPEKSGSAATVPESSTAKRPLKEAAASEAIKKQKTSETEHVKKPVKNDEVKKISGDDAKKMFQRLFSEADEIALLQGIIDFTSTKGDPYEDIDAFCIYVKKLIDFNATKNQIVTKLQRLKKKFNNTVKKSLKKGKSEDEIEFAKDIEQKGFELSRKIWGSSGVLASKSSRKKVGGTPAPKEMKLVAHSSPKKQQEEAKKPEKTEAKVVITSLSIGREIASFFNAENKSSCGLDESTISAVWAKVADGAEKREVEEKWKKLKAKEFELCLQRSGLVNETAKMIFKAYES